MKPAKAVVLAERETLIAAATLVPRRRQKPCPNCRATSVRIDWISCCWNPIGGDPT